jgi:peptidoglycan/LPS O-acetylase OafA/YrhL
MKLIYFKNLDGIRAIAAFMVIFFHFFKGQLGITGSGELWKFLDKISIIGQNGVTLFFVLSGFLITRILLSTKSNPNYFKSFYTRRVLRIFPLYYFFLLCYYFLPLFWGGSVAPLRDQMCYYFYLESFAETFRWGIDGPRHFWSLAVEEHFYLFWPLIVYSLSNKNLCRFILAIIVGAILLRAYMTSLHYEVYWFTFTRIDSLAIGGLLSLMELKGFFIEKNYKKFLLLLSLIFAPLIVLWAFFTGSQNAVIQIFKYDFVSLLFFGLIGIVLCIKEGNLINRILSSSFFSYHGKISYGLYVYHSIGFWLSVKYIQFDFWPLSFLMGYLVTMLMATVSFYSFEERFLSLKRLYQY